MSRNDQQKKSNTVKLDASIIDRKFSIRLWDGWEMPSLIIRLTRAEKVELSQKFDIHWDDLDIKLSWIQECIGTGTALDVKKPWEKPFTVAQNLRRTDEGIYIEIQVVAKTHVKEPLLDEQGFPRKATIERLFPQECFLELFNRSKAFMRAMDCQDLAYRAKVEENDDVYANLGRALEFAKDSLNNVSPVENLTVPAGEVVEHNQKQKKGKGKKKSKRTDSAASTEIADGPAAETARVLTQAATGVDPDAEPSEEGGEDEASFENVMPAGQDGDHQVEPVTPVAQASAATKPSKKDRPSKTLKLGSPEAAAFLTERGASTPDGSNGQGS